MYRWIVRYYRWGRFQEGFVDANDADSAWHLANRKYPDVREVGMEDA